MRASCKTPEKVRGTRLRRHMRGRKVCTLERMTVNAQRAASAYANVASQSS